MLNHLQWISFCCLSILIVTGCSSKLATVTGQVTLDDQPLTTGNVSFNPVGDGPVGVGTIQPNGSYSVSTGTANGLPPGDYIVTVVATKPVAPSPANPEPVPQLITPQKYGTRETTDLKCSVKAGSNKQDFHLRSN